MSISHERTFAEISDRDVLVAKCKSLCEALAENLKAEECKVGAYARVWEGGK